MQSPSRGHSRHTVSRTAARRACNTRPRRCVATGRPDRLTPIQAPTDRHLAGHRPTAPPPAPSLSPGSDDPQTVRASLRRVTEVCGEEPLGQHGVDGDALFLWQAAAIAIVVASGGVLSTGVTAAGCSCSSSRHHRAAQHAAAAATTAHRNHAKAPHPQSKLCYNSSQRRSGLRDVVESYIYLSRPRMQLRI